MSNSNTAETIKLLRAAKPASPVNFAYGMASAAKDSVLIVDRNKAPAQLLPLAKKSGKACAGKAFLEDGEIVFQTDDAPSGLQRSLADWFRLNKVTQKPVVAGKPEEDEGDEEENEDGHALFSGPMVLRRLRQSMRVPMNFGFGVGRGDEKNLLALHPRREGKRLGALVRRENGAVRGSFGRVELNGAIAEFRCERTPIPQLRKMLRALFKANEIRFRPKVFGPEGEVIEPGDAEDDAADAAAEAGAQGGADTAAETARLRTVLSGMIDRLKPIVAGDAEHGAETRTVYGAADAALKAGNIDAARGAIERLETIATEGEDALAEVAELRAEMQRLLPSLRELVPLPEGGQVRPTWSAAEAALKIADLKASHDAMQTLRMLAARGADARRLALLRTAWPAARTAWQEASDEADRQISAVQRAMQSSGDEELEQIAEFGLAALTGRYKVRMMAAVREIDGANLDTLRRAIALGAGIARDFLEHVREDERFAALDDDEFGLGLRLTDTLGQGLETVLTTLRKVASA